MRYKAIIYGRITDYDISCRFNDGSMRIRFNNYNSIGFEEWNIRPNEYGYAIIHHNEMTDEDVCFLCQKKQPLLDFDNRIFREFLTTEDSARFYELQNEMERQGIIAKDVCEVYETHFILNTYSYRF